MKLTPAIQKAINVAAFAHRHQMRKDDKTPYIVHPFGVAFILSNYTTDEDVVIAGLLHDIIEDVSDQYNEQEMRADFGNRVTDIVLGVTEDSDIEDWVKRKQDYRNTLEKSSDESMMVSAADLINNLNGMTADCTQYGNDFLEKFNGNDATRFEAYRKRIEIIASRLDSPIVDELKTSFRNFLTCTRP
ncbi:MAG: HD domain-containing protein [Candidatus Saccharimonadales bacterium]